MVLSHEYRYVFVELPLTATTSIRRELISLYGGESVHKRHSTIFDFLRHAGPEERKYFSFSCIRNPLDQAVSHFFKFRGNHNNRFTDPAKLAGRTGVRGRLAKLSDLRRFRHVQSDPDNFASFFMRFYRLSYDNWSCVNHPRTNFMLRFERLDEDFSRVLSKLKIEQQRPLPRINRTRSKKGHFTDYYSPRTYERAQRVFGIYMARWGYEFPSDWDEPRISARTRIEHRLLDLPRRLYWQHIRDRV